MKRADEINSISMIESYHADDFSARKQAKPKPPITEFA